MPKGEEETTERNLDIFYIRSLKAIGCVHNLFPSHRAVTDCTRIGTVTSFVLVVLLLGRLA